MLLSRVLRQAQGIQRVGFGPPAVGLEEVAYGRRIDHTHAPAVLMGEIGQRGLVPARGFQRQVDHVHPQRLALGFECLG